MKPPPLATIFAFLSLLAFWQSMPREQGKPSLAAPPLNQRVEHFDLNDAILRDGVVELSSNPIEGLHLGIEEILRENINDNPRTQNPHFSLHLENKTVREILDALCDSDARYMWSTDGLSISIYPRATVGDAAYLLNQGLERINLTNVPDPDEALTPLAKLLPDEQIGYTGFGDVQYANPGRPLLSTLRSDSLSTDLLNTWVQGAHGFGRVARGRECLLFRGGGFRSRSNN
jgi:hypothetical protein